MLWLNPSSWFLQLSSSIQYCSLLLTDIRPIADSALARSTTNNIDQVVSLLCTQANSVFSSKVGENLVVIYGQRG